MVTTLLMRVLEEAGSSRHVCVFMVISLSYCIPQPTVFLVYNSGGLFPDLHLCTEVAYIFK